MGPGQYRPGLSGGRRARLPPGTPDCDIDANDAWDIATGSSDVVVAVIDTGVDYTHRDLQNNMWTDDNGSYGHDFVNDDNDPMDDAGHGTHCAGIIAADGNNAYDIAGASWNARIMGLKFLSRRGTGETADAIPAIAYAVDNGADVISNSWSGSKWDLPLRDAFDYAYSQGVVAVAAAGNNNTNSPRYPGAFDHVIAVAATDSNDEKASFSNYGDWVDLAAPGVDILSLRANGTSGGYPIFEHTTVASGTSMACPHVAGACALLLSVNPYMTPDDMRDILMDTVDVVFDPNDHVCGSNGRLNIHDALVAAVDSRGYVSLDKDYYNCDCNILISLADADLAEEDTHDVSITSSGGDSETVTLYATYEGSGVFAGEIPTDSGEPNSEDELLQVSHADTITVTYQDANDGTGTPRTVTDVATADCVYPQITSDVEVVVLGPDVTVTFETDEYTLGKVLYDSSCGGPSYKYSNADFGFDYSIKLTEVSPWTNHYFIVEATDRAGNTIVDNNDGDCYGFSTEGPNDFNVPGDFNSIQDAVDYSWDGGSVTVSPGTYNEIVNFKGRAITIRSTNPSDWDIVKSTIIDSNMYPAFMFQAGEDANSVASGFTVKGDVTNIYVDSSDPTISHCIIEGSYGDTAGSPYGILCLTGSPVIVNNIIRGVYGIRDSDGMTFGMGIICRDDAAVIKNNLIYANGGGIFAGSYYALNASTIMNNTIVDNLGVGVYNYKRKLGADGTAVVLKNCVLWRNYSNDVNSVSEDGENHYHPWPLTVTYSCIGDEFDPNDPNYVGAIHSDPCFVNACRFLDKTAANGSQTTIVAADANLYEVDDVIEYNNDGVVRTVTDVNIATGRVAFANDSLDANSIFGALIYNWGPDATDLDEDYRLASDSNCIDAGDPNGDYDGQTDIDGHPRVMVTEVDIGADESAYFPPDHNDYDEWLEIGQPVSWCYPRQCHGDADGLKLLDPNDPVGPFWVQQNDLDILLAAWHQPYSGDPEEDPWIAADFDHEEEGGPKTGYFRVLYNDLSILTASWKQPDANIPGDCSNCQ